MTAIAILDEVVKLERECFTDYWTKESIIDSLKLEHNLLIVAYTDDDGKPCEKIIFGGGDFKKRFLEAFSGVEDYLFEGYAIANVIGEESELLRIAVARDIRRNHFGSRLMHRYLNGTKAVSYFLEVRMGNVPARGLYEKMGYKQLAIRKGYYNNPVEDAVVYKFLK